MYSDITNPFLIFHISPFLCLIVLDLAFRIIGTLIEDQLKNLKCENWKLFICHVAGPFPPQQTLDHYPGFSLLLYGGENPTSWKFSPSPPPRKIPPSRLTKGFQKVTSGTKWSLLKMCHLKHRLRIFLFHTKIMFRSQDIQVFVFLTIQWFTRSVTSRWILVHEARCVLEYNFWTINMKSPNLASW